MRVIAGYYRGRTLKTPKGKNTRPTTDRVKETLMSTLLSAYGSLEGTHVLDAFAGSGALGIECLSRGAKDVHFFERNSAAFEVLRENIAALKIPEEKVRIFKTDILKNPPLQNKTPYDIVFLDPPYAYEPKNVLAMIDRLKRAKMLSQDAMISYEHDASVEIVPLLEDNLDKTYIQATKRFGTIAIDIFSFASN